MFSEQRCVCKHTYQTALTWKTNCIYSILINTAGGISHCLKYLECPFLESKYIHADSFCFDSCILSPFNKFVQVLSCVPSI